MARHATRGVPAEADALADAQTFHLIADRGDSPRDFVAGDERKGGHAPFVIDHGKVRVTDAAMGDGDLDLLRRERAGIEFKRLQRRAFFQRGKSFNGGAHLVRWLRRLAAAVVRFIALVDPLHPKDRVAFPVN